MWVWNGAHDDMFSKSSALPRHSFEEQPARREERKRDSVCECGRGSRREISRVFRRMILADWPICSAGASKFTQTARVVTPTAATEREREQEVPWHAAPVTWPLLAWSPSSHLFFFFSLPFSVFTPTASAAVVCGSSPRPGANVRTWCLGAHVDSRSLSLIVLLQVRFHTKWSSELFITCIISQ